MPKLTKAQAKRRLNEAMDKLNKCLSADHMTLEQYAKARAAIMASLRRLG